MRTGNEPLPVPMTDAESRAKGEAASRLHREIELLTQARKDAAKDAADRIADLKGEETELLADVRQGTRLEQTEVEYRPDLVRRVVEVIRLDTGDVVRSQSITEADLQVTIDEVISTRHADSEGARA